jgi:hypothetical protein
MTVEYNPQFELLSRSTLVKPLFKLGLGPVKPTTKTVPKEAGIRALSVYRFVFMFRSGTRYYQA